MLVLDPRFGPDRWVDGQHMVIDLWNADLRRRGYEVDVVSSAHRGRARAGAPSLASVAKCADELVARTRHAPHRLAIAHGFESGEAARRLSQRGCRVVSVVHYSVAQAFDSELRRRAPVAMRGPLPLGLVRVASALARAGPRMPAALRMLESERALLEAGARTLAVGTGFRDWLRDFYPGSAERIFAVPLAARAWSETEREWPLPDSDRMRIISVGRAAPQKGWDFAADALAALEARRPELADRLEFVAVGPVPESSFGREVVARFKRLRRVRWTLLGAQPWEAVQRMLNAADVMLHPSRFEPYGLAIEEAIRAGCAIVASDAHGAVDQMAGREGTHLLRLGDQGSFHQRLAEAILSCLARLPEDRRSRRRRRAEHATPIDSTVDHLERALCGS